MRPRLKTQESDQLRRDVERWLADGNEIKKLPGFNMRTSFAFQPLRYDKTKNP